MDLKEVILWLVAERFIEFQKGKPRFTDQGRKAIKDATTGFIPEKAVTEAGLVPVNLSTEVMVPEGKYSDGQWSNWYREFLLNCEIPAKCHGRDGQSYELNKYSIEGMKAFKKAIQSGYRLDALTVAVKLYYKNSVQLKKAVGNYMVSEEWRTDYETVVQKAQEGKIEEHIKQEMKRNGSVSNYTFGRAPFRGRRDQVD